MGDILPIPLGYGIPYTNSTMSAKSTYDKISLLRLALQGLEENELGEIASLSRFCSYPAGHVLCQEGAYEEIMYIIAEGNVLITQKMSEEEGERVLRIGGKGDLVGEMALIQNAPRSATVRTTTTCTMLEMGKKDFETILRRSPRLANEIIRITLDRLRENHQTAIAELQEQQTPAPTGSQQAGIHPGSRARIAHAPDRPEGLRGRAGLLPGCQF